MNGDREKNRQIETDREREQVSKQRREKVIEEHYILSLFNIL